MRQRGAIFGLDLRMAIVIGGLMATVISAEMLSDFEGDRQIKGERKLEALRDALLTRYSNASTSTFTSTLSSLYTDGYMQSSGAYYAGEATAQTAVDGWGSTVQVAVYSTTRTIMATTGVPVHFGILVSPGPDKIMQSTVALPNENTFISWAAQGDDLAIKFNTVLIERDRILVMKDKLQRIMEALRTYAQRAEITHVTACTASTCNCSTVSSVCSTTCSGATPAVGYCDTSGDNYYYLGEESAYNFYPPDSVEAIANSALSYSTVRGLTSYISGNLANMQSLMTLVGLPTTFAQDPWGRTLRYDSNEYNTTAAPYTASVWYQ